MLCAIRDWRSREKDPYSRPYTHTYMTYISVYIYVYAYIYMFIYDIPVRIYTIYVYIYIYYKTFLFVLHSFVHWLTAIFAGEEEGYGDEF